MVQVFCFLWKGRANVQRLSSPGFCAVCTEEAPLSLLRFALRRGFKGLTVSFLKQLMAHMAWTTTPVPRSERDVVAFVASQVQPGITDEEVEYVLLQRHCKPFRSSLGSSIKASCRKA